MTFTAQVCRLLSEWITFLLAAVPPRSRRTFIELLCGCLMSQEGWVTRAISIIGRKCHWTAYFKLLERGSLKTQALANQLLRLVMQFSCETILTFVLDDTLLLRWSDSAPGVAIRHEHSRKPNRPRYVNAQCWVTLGVVRARCRRHPLTPGAAERQHQQAFHRRRPDAGRGGHRARFARARR